MLYQTPMNCNMNIVNLNMLLSFISTDISSLVDLFKYKSVHDVVLFHCYKDNTAIAVQNVLIKHNIRTSTVKISDSGVSYKIPYTYSRIGIIVNASCSNWKRILDKMNSNVTFQNPFIWVFITDDLTVAVDSLSKFPIEADADVTIVHKKEINLFYDVYNTGFRNKGSFNVKYIGHWNSSLFVAKKNERNDLSGVIIRCYIVIIEKLMNQTFDEYLSHITYDQERTRRIGYDPVHRMKYFTIMVYLRDMYNMTYDLQRADTWGYNHNGSFDGMVGSLQRHEAEFGGAPLFFRTERIGVIDFVAEVWRTKHTFIFRHPKHSSGYYKIYSRPLVANVWYCILTLLVLSGAVLFLIFRLNILRARDEEDASPSLAWLFMWSALCQQGMTLSQKSTSVKVLVFITFFYAVILYQYYNAVVVSTLLLEPPRNIRTLKDLVESDLKAGMEDALYDRDFLKLTTDPIALEMYHKKIKNGNKVNFYLPVEGMTLVKRGGFAFHVDTILSYGIMRKTFSEKEICEASEVFMYGTHGLGFVMSTRSPYRDHVAYGIRKMMEAGLMDRIQSIWDEPKPQCVNTPDSSIYSVTIREISSPLTVIVVGILMSLLVLILEIFLDRIWRRWNTIVFCH